MKILHKVEMRYQPERALTLIIVIVCYPVHNTGRNEVSAREGIDTLIWIFTCNIIKLRRNEVSAREGIDTRAEPVPIYYCCDYVEMRYQPERALTPSIPA